MSLSPDQKLAAYLLGRRIAGQRRKQDRVPVAYLYNEITAPKLPARDEEKYPYLIMYDNYFMYTGGAMVYYLSEPFVIERRNTDEGSDPEDWYMRKKDGSPFDVIWRHYNKYDDSVWGDESKMTVQKTEVEILTSIKSHCWANYDVMDTNGNLWLSASKPVPVYE